MRRLPPSSPATPNGGKVSLSQRIHNVIAGSKQSLHRHLDSPSLPSPSLPPSIIIKRGSASSIGIRRRCLTNSLYLFAACCCLFELYWMTKFNPSSTNKSQRSAAQKKLKVVDNEPPNTNWKNVQYNRGMFGKEMTLNDWVIQLRCTKDAAVFQKNFSICLGPIETNISCCYCHFPRQGEEELFVNNYASWSCAVPRKNSLLPFNNTRVDVKGARIVWITGRFGHGDYFRDYVGYFCQRVREMNLFDAQDAYCYWDSPDFVLQNKKFSKHLKYRTDPDDVSHKGGGFWFHKSVLLREHLDANEDGDFLVYTDIDRMDFFELGNFHAVLETLASRGDDLAMETTGNSVEQTYTKEDMLAAFNASVFTRKSPQLLANMIVIRNGPKMKRFMDAWVDCMADWHMVTDEPSILPNAPKFADHRHDQSVLSLLVKTFMTKQDYVGVPARPFHPNGGIATYKFRSGVDPTCPFSSFYAANPHLNITVKMD